MQNHGSKREQNKRADKAGDDLPQSAPLTFSGVLRLMDIDDIKKLIDLIQETGIGEIEIREGEKSVRITRSSVALAATPSVTHLAPALSHQRPSLTDEQPAQNPPNTRATQ